MEWNFPDRLQDAMTDAMVTAEDFEESDICAASTINSYISGKSVPNLRTAQAIAEFLQVSLDYLVGDTRDDRRQSLIN